jgi:hypothetical protein
MNIQEFIKAKEEEFDERFGKEGVIAKTDENCILIGFTKKELKHFLSQSILEYNEKIKEMTIETAEQWFTINPKYRTKKRLLDDIITNLTQDTNPKE